MLHHLISHFAMCRLCVSYSRHMSMSHTVNTCVCLIQSTHVYVAPVGASVDRVSMGVSIDYGCLCRYLSSGSFYLPRSLTGRRWNPGPSGARRLRKVRLPRAPIWSSKRIIPLHQYGLGFRVPIGPRTAKNVDNYCKAPMRNIGRSARGNLVQ